MVKGKVKRVAQGGQPERSGATSQPERSGATRQPERSGAPSQPERSGVTSQQCSLGWATEARRQTGNANHPQIAQIFAEG